MGPSPHQTREKMAVCMIRSRAQPRCKRHGNAYHSVIRNSCSSSPELLFSRNRLSLNKISRCMVYSWHLSLKPVAPSHSSALYCASLLTIFSLPGLPIPDATRRDATPRDATRRTAPPRPALRCAAPRRAAPDHVILAKILESSNEHRNFNLKLPADIPLHPPFDRFALISYDALV